MADSQNTYQNDVKISGGSSAGIVKAILAVAVAGLIGFLGYGYHTNAVENAYEDGYDKAYEEGYDEGYEFAYEIAYDKGYDKGDIDGYNRCYEKYVSKDSSGFDFSSVVEKTQESSSSTSPSSSNPKTYDYILNKNTDKFHYSWCSSVGQMKEKNKIYFTGTRTEVINKGYAPCKNCNP